MSKTAEEHLNDYLGQVDKTLFRNCVKPAMHAFAAQEVAKEIEAYKGRLKQAFENADGGDINYIIDTVK